ncbi:conserved hypothetical protein [Listeria monocytogenes HCC23]|uniref:Uncharacterized protein n=1 Tax=Listeria monocytogenes serotype 4a (strain M7) TaxID=1030009 RepID=A0A0E0UV80_LISMM|nr:conserved hypothetical protein [Listeria monocytogenes HCC23]AEH92261.1 hypothetical protein LMM7_1256 [Listeria monocytogenes M7]
MILDESATKQESVICTMCKQEIEEGFIFIKKYVKIYSVEIVMKSNR